MYIKFKNGSIVQTRFLKPGEYPNSMENVESITDERPRLANMDDASVMANPYMGWSHIYETSTEEEDVRNVFCDIVDYLTHTKQILTPLGLKEIGEIVQVKPPVRKVQVAYAYTTGNNTARVYGDVDGNEYCVVRGMSGVYKKVLTEDDIASGHIWDELRMWDVELDIQPAIPAKPTPVTPRGQSGC